MIGTRLVNRYEVVGELGRGGMGVVYRARDPQLNRDVAVKLVPPSLLTPQAEERFQREAQLVAQMNHPSIVSIFDIGRHEGTLFFLMPVVSGTNLRSFLAERPRSLGEVLEIAVQVADALDYSHARGIIHRDIKPENIMISGEGQALRVYVMDFGLAKASSENRLTKTGTLVGTVDYFSPEQVIATREIDGRSDIYSLGTVLYECLTGQAPFSGEVQSVLYRIVHENPRTLREAGADVPEELDDIVMRCLAKDPARRFQRAGELAEALRRHHSRLHDSERSKSVVLSTVMTAQFQRPSSAPFIGREKEFAELQRRLNNAIDGECQFVVIGGEPGVGKSRLLEELEKLAQARKIRVLHGRFVEQNRAFAYQGFCEVIQDFFRVRGSTSSAEHVDLSDLASELVSLFPVLGEVSAIRSAVQGEAAARDTRKPEDRTAIYELLARTLTRLGAGKPLVLALENLHGAEMSLDALEYVIQRLAPTKTLILGTYRQTEVERGHALLKLMDSFSDDAHFSSITLGPLSPSEHRQLVESLVGSQRLAPGLADRLYGATDANPFFTKELIRSLMDSGGLTRDESGSWSLSGEMAIFSDALPATIQQAVEKRIERLPDEQREILSIASVFGKSFEFDDLKLLAEDAKGLDKIIDRLVADGWIEEERESRGDRLTFASGIVRDVLYAAVSRRRRRSLHRRYAEHLEQKYANRLDRIYPQLVHHYSEGDVPEKTVEYGMQLAQRSLQSFSAEETIHVTRVMLEFLKDQEWSGDRGLEGETRLLLANAQRMLGNADAALREAEQAARIFQRERKQHRAVDALRLAAETAWQARRVDDTRRWLEQGIAAARQADVPEPLHGLLSLAATVANLRGEYDRAKDYLEEAERLVPAPKPKVQEETIPRGGRLVAALVNPISAVEPAEATTDEETEVFALVFETLVSMNDEGNLIPLLSEKWEVSEGGRSLVVSLRPEARFEDGTPLTAELVKCSFERAVRRRKGGLPPALAVIEGAEQLRRAEREELGGVVVRGPHELKIQLSEPLPIYPALLTDPNLGVVLAAGNGRGRLAGTGPFRMARCERDQVILERNERYWRATPALLDAIDFRVFPSAAAIASAFRSGQVDLARDLPPSDFEEFLRDPRFRSGLVEAPRKNTYFAVFNLAGPVTRHDLIRRALSGTVRVHDLVWRTLGRLALPAAGIIPPSIFGHDPGRRRSPLSREEALGLIRQSGLQEPIKLTASLHPLYRERYRPLADSIFEIWRELGINVEVITANNQEYQKSFRDNEAVDVLIGRWVSDFDDPDNFTHTLFHSGNGIFSQYFSSVETDRLLEEAREATQPATREALYRKFENQLFAAGALIPLFHEIDYRIGGPRVRRLQLRSSRPYVNYAELGKTEEIKQVSAAVRLGGGTINIAIHEQIRNLDPRLCYSAEESEVIQNIFQTLTRSGESANIGPWLAAEFQAEDGARRFRFRLREDVRFHDGRRLTARDVRFSWERMLRGTGLYQRMLSAVRGAEALIRGEAEDLAGFRILSNRDFVVELENPLVFFPAFLSHTSAGIVPEGTDQISGNWREGCVGTGPFRVVQFDPGRLLELERNPGYWLEGYPRSDRLVFHFGVPPADARKEFQAGRLSLVSNLLPTDAEALMRDPQLAAGYRETPRLSIYYFALNCRSGPLAHTELRHALIDGIDLPALLRRSVGRLVVSANGLIPPGLLGYSPERGAIPSAAPTRHTPALELTAAMHPLFHDQYAAFARELTGILRDRGVHLKASGKTMEEFRTNRLTADVVLGRWIGDYPDSDTFMYGLVHSTGGYLGHLCGTREMDRLIEQARAEIDPTARHAIYREVEEQIAREARILPLFHEQIYRFARPEVEGLTLNFGGRPEVVYENLTVNG